MRFRGIFLAALAALAYGALGTGRAAASQVLYNGSGFVTGTQSFSQSFNITTPGTLTVTLQNVNWPTSLASLSGLVTTPGGGLSSSFGVGTSSFNIKAGDIFAEWFGTAQGALNTGVYSLEIQFQPGTAANPVPLPTSIALLLSGLALLIWQRRSRGETAEPGFGYAGSMH